MPKQKEIDIFDIFDVPADVIKEYIDEFIHGGSDGWTSDEFNVIKKFIIDIVRYNEVVR